MLVHDEATPRSAARDLSLAALAGDADACCKAERQLRDMLEQVGWRPKLLDDLVVILYSELERCDTPQRASLTQTLGELTAGPNAWLRGAIAERAWGRCSSAASGDAAKAAQVLAAMHHCGLLDASAIRSVVGAPPGEADDAWQVPAAVTGKARRVMEELFAVDARTQPKPTDPAEMPFVHNPYASGMEPETDEASGCHSSEMCDHTEHSAPSVSSGTQDSGVWCSPAEEPLRAQEIQTTPDVHLYVPEARPWGAPAPTGSSILQAMPVDETSYAQAASLPVAQAADAAPVPQSAPASFAVPQLVQSPPLVASTAPAPPHAISVAAAVSPTFSAAPLPARMQVPGFAAEPRFRRPGPAAAMRPRRGRDSKLHRGCRAEMKRPSESLFTGIGTKRELRTAGLAILNRALQQGSNRSYGGARRRLTHWCLQKGVNADDTALLVVFLNELYLAGYTYCGAADRSIFVADVPGLRTDCSGSSCGSIDRASWYSRSSTLEQSLGPSTPRSRLGAMLRRLSRLSLPGSEDPSPTPDLAEIESARSNSAVPTHVTVDDRVTVRRRGGRLETGVVKYIGFPAFHVGAGQRSEGCWIGVALDERTGVHDGAIGGERFFEADPASGVFVRASRVEPLPDGVEGPAFFYPQDVTGHRLRLDTRHEALRNYGLRHGDTVMSAGGESATVIGVRHGLLHWVQGGCGVRGVRAAGDSPAKILALLASEGYRRTGVVSVPNHVGSVATPCAASAVESYKLLPPATVERLEKLPAFGVDRWEGALKRPCPPMDLYRAWLRRQLRQHVALL